MHALQTPAVQLEQFNAQQYPDCKKYPGLQVMLFVSDEHEIQAAGQLLHTPNDR